MELLADEDEDSCDDICGSPNHVHGICDGGDHDVVPVRGDGKTATAFL